MLKDKCHHRAQRLSLPPKQFHNLLMTILLRSDPLLSFSKVMSCSSILAFGLTKKGFHQCGQLLNATQCAYHELLHLTLGLH